MYNDAYIKRTNEKIRKALDYYAPYIFRDVDRAESVLAYETKDHLRKPPAADAMHAIEPGTDWGCEYGNLWLRTSYTVPAALEGQTVCVVPDVNAVEILCFKDDIPAGIINSKNRFIGGEHSAMFAAKSAKAGETLDLAFDCYAGHECLGTQPYDNFFQDGTDPKNYVRRYQGVRIVVMDKTIRDFVFDTMTVLQLAELPGENFAAMRAKQCLLKAFPYIIQDIRAVTEEEIRESAATVSEILAPALVKNGGDSSRGTVAVLGHSHMDTAWLWPVEETIRKCARTYSQVLTYMDMYPDYQFIQSSALHLDWMREYYPDIFEGIKQRVAEGRYEPNGGVWVECDCNVTGGEAMVRQFLYGQRYTMQHLNYKSDSFWLPDTFGYNAAIPQIMLGCGVKYFYTTKMSWADLNKFPTNTFRWRGLDGSEVLTNLFRLQVMPDVQQLNDMAVNCTDRNSCDMALAAYGFGDGGGGPTYGMQEFLKRTMGLEGMPKIEPMTATKFMEKVEQKRDDLPVYDGELYLELHRGTLTTMHEVKRNNRKAEIALHNLELFNVLSEKAINENRDALYKIMLKNQFHDILPGTCIPRVYDICIPEMHKMIADTQAETKAYMDSMTEAAADTLSLYNPLSFDRKDVVTLDGAYGLEGCTAQTYTDLDGNQKTAVKACIPAMEAVSLKITAPTASPSAFRAEGNVLTTPFYRVTFDENGYISDLLDLEADRQVNREGGVPLGTLWMGEDMPKIYDNWDVDDDIFRKLKPVKNLISSEVVADGAVEYRIRNTYRLSKTSTMAVDLVFYAENRRIDFEAKVDWQERHRLLKVGFDVNVRSAFVKNEIQFGHMDRPTTRNTSLEDSKFEICNHKWSDLSETHYGVALLNDCKYGLSVEGSDMRLTLHKGGCRPDPVNDNGLHTMTYSLLPHLGAMQAENVIQPAYELNYPAIATEGKLNVPKLFSLSNPGIICEAVKNAEDVENGYVIRLYEAERNSSNCTLTLHGAKAAWATNMLEEKQEQLELVNGQVKLKFRPFEIKTILVER